MKTMLFFGCLFSLVVFGGCATSPGDTPECPQCDNVTEIRVGDKCVAIDQVEPCGPDGHAHGSECHCASGQQPTTIGSTEYCLQADCNQTEVDIDALACEEIDQTPNPVTPVLSFQDFETAHVDLERVAEVDLPDNQESFVHFEGIETAEYAIFLDTANVLDTVLEENSQALPSHVMGANSDCQSSLPEVWHVEVENESELPQPQIIRLKAGTVNKIKLVIYQLEENGHE